MKRIYPTNLSEASEYLRQLGIIEPEDETQTDFIAQTGYTFTYNDMAKAFTAGRRHYKECGDTNNDCWDFTTWVKNDIKT